MSKTAIDQIIEMSAQRPLKDHERERLVASMDALRRRAEANPGESALQRRIKQLEEDLANARKVIRDNDLNEIMD